MPSFSDDGVIISLKKYSEKSLIVKVLTRHHGIYRGFVKAANSTKSRAIFQVGNLISFEFRSRLDENLGQLAALDLVKSYGGKVIFDCLYLDCMNALLSTLDERFLEREPQEELFAHLLHFLEELSHSDGNNHLVIANYVKLELEILRSLGYGLDLSCCVVTSATTGLAFVSPKSGRAVSLQAGLPYEDKLLKLPQFLLDDTANYNSAQLIDGLRLSGYFLGRAVKEEQRFGEKNSRAVFYRSRVEESYRKKITV